ncbi:MAG: T9SS type A sorting domain-containing protein [Bacteroidota bacterium]
MLARFYDKTLILSCVLVALGINLFGQKVLEDISNSTLDSAEIYFRDNLPPIIDHSQTPIPFLANDSLLSALATGDSIEIDDFTNSSTLKFRVDKIDTTRLDSIIVAKNNLNGTSVYLIKNKYGYVAKVNFLASGDQYLIFPDPESDRNLHFLCKLQEIPNSTCSNYNSSCPSPSCPEVEEAVCNNSCISEISLLILISPEAYDFLGGHIHTEYFIEILNIQLYEVFYNSEVNIPFNYKWNYLYEDVVFDNNCPVQACEFGSNIDANILRDSYSSDIVILITDNQVWSNQACAANFGPVPESAYILQPPHTALNNYVFSHEIGHVFGLRHARIQQSRGCCGHGARVNIYNRNRSTIMQSVFDNFYSNTDIPYFSNPDIYIDGVQLSEHSNPAANSAGWLRAKACDVSNFRTTPPINALINYNIQNCQYNISIDANLSSNLLPSFDYTWYISESPVYSFSEFNSMVSIGTGMNIQIPDYLLPDPCKYYFIHLKVENSGMYIIYESMYVKGGGCTVNVWCPDNNSTAKPALNDLSSMSWLYDHTNGFNFRLMRHSHKSDTVINNKDYSIFSRVSTVIRPFFGDTIEEIYDDYIFGITNDVFFASFYGEDPDTLYNFGGDIGDSWTIEYSGDANLGSIEMTIMDKFEKDLEGRIFDGMVVEYLHEDGFPSYQDSILENIGSLLVFINPFDYFEQPPDLTTGGVIRCYSESDDFNLAFNTESILGLEIDCQNDFINSTSNPTQRDTYKIWPNPTSSMLNIQNSRSTEISGAIFSSTGLEVSRFERIGASTTIDVSNLPRGMYIIKFEDGYTYRFIKT